MPTTFSLPLERGLDFGLCTDHVQHLNYYSIICSERSVRCIGLIKTMLMLVNLDPVLCTSVELRPYELKHIRLLHVWW